MRVFARIVPVTFLVLLFGGIGGSAAWAQGLPPILDDLAAETGVPAPGALGTDADYSEVERQAGGGYDQVRRKRSIPLGDIQKAWNDPQAGLAAGQDAPGVTRYSFDPYRVMPMEVRELMPSTIQLPKWEKVERPDVVWGDRENFTVDILSDNVLIVTANHPGADTGLTVRGRTGNLYAFYVRSIGTSADHISDVLVFVTAPRADRTRTGTGGGGVVSFFAPAAGTPSTASTEGSLGGVVGVSRGAELTEPSDGGGNTRSEEPWDTSEVSEGRRDAVEPLLDEGEPDWLRNVPFNAKELRFGVHEMRAGGGDNPESIAPDIVFSDNRFTYLYYAHERMDVVNRPVVHVVIDQIDNPVNTRTSGPFGNIIVVEAIGDLTLTNGERIICIKYLGDGHQPVKDVFTKKAME